MGAGRYRSVTLLLAGRESRLLAGGLSSAEALRRAFGDLDALAPIVEVSGDIARARIEIRPYAFEEDAGTRSASPLLPLLYSSGR